MTFNGQHSLKAVHFQKYNTTALLYLVKIGGGGRELNFTQTRQRNLAVSLEKLDQNYCIIFPSSLNMKADLQSQNSKEPSGLKLCHKLFQQLCRRRRITNYSSTLFWSPTLSARDKCPTTNPVQSISLWIFPILLYSTILLILPEKFATWISLYNCKNIIATSGADTFSERLLKKGFTESAAQLITSRRQNYNWSCSM